MQKLFNKILVPVNFTAGPEVILEKAAAIAMQYDCSIHLLHVVPYSVAFLPAMETSGERMPNDIIANKNQLQLQMESLCSSIINVPKNSLQTSYSIVEGTWDEVIIDIVNEQQYDLVLIGQRTRLIQRRKLRINPDIIAQRTNIPVITLPVNRRITDLCAIVIPVTDFLPIKKLMYGIYLSHQCNSTIKLLGIENKITTTNLQYYLIKAYYLVKDNCNVPVELKIVEGSNVEEAVNEFANLNAADLIIMNPATETKMRVFLFKLLHRAIQKYSALPVLTINLA